MPRLIGGPLDGQTTKKAVPDLIMPVHGTDTVAFYRRRWEDGDYQFVATTHEDEVLGPRKDEGEE